MFADVEILDSDYGIVGGLLLPWPGLARTFSKYIYNFSFLEEEFLLSMLIKQKDMVKRTLKY